MNERFYFSLKFPVAHNKKIFIYYFHKKIHKYCAAKRKPNDKFNNDDGRTAGRHQQGTEKRKTTLFCLHSTIIDKKKKHI